MDRPHKKKYESLDAIKVEHSEYLKLIREIHPHNSIKDDMRHISVSEFNDFVVRVNYWNLDVMNKKIAKIGVYSTFDPKTGKTTTALVPLGSDGKPVISGPTGPADGPSYIN